MRHHWDQSRPGRRKAVARAAALAAVLALGPALAAAAKVPPEPPATLPPAGSCTVAAGTWPEYQGDPTHAADACGGPTTADVTQLKPAWFVGTTGVVTDTPAVDWGSVFAGDYTGALYSIAETTGRIQWTFDTASPQTCYVDAADPHTDAHAAGFGQMPASPATADIDGTPTVFAAAGGSLYAISATTGSCLWADDVDPGAPANAVEIESSPLVDTHTDPPEVLVGDDDNSSSGVAVTGLLAFDAVTGALLWRYEPERDLTLYPSQFGGSAAATLDCGDGSSDPDCTPSRIPGLAPDSTAYADGCGDVWSSPALDAAFVDPGGANSFEGSGSVTQSDWYAKRITASGWPSRDGLVVFGTGNCSASPDPAAALAHGDYVDNEGVFALDPVTGTRVWDFLEPYNEDDQDAAEPGGGDDDFGSSPIVAALPTGTVAAEACPTSTLVIEGSKSGYAYGLCVTDGADVWSAHAAQSGEVGSSLVGSVGGFLGSPALGDAGGRPTVFFTSAIPTPLSNDGLRTPDSGDTNIASCPGLSEAPLLPACPDLSLADDPERAAGLHAVDAATGRVDYQAPAAPTYAAATYSGGVVFLPDSLAASLIAFDADSGTPLLAVPLGAVPASGAAVAGDAVFFGTGEADSTAEGEAVPPQATGIWSFSTDPGEVTVTPPPAP